MRMISPNISALALTAMLSTSLVLSGCGDKNKSKSVANEVKIEEIAVRKVDNAQAERALAALSLNDSGSGVLSWSGKTGDSGNYVFNNVIIQGEDKDDQPMKIETMELKGAHMQGDLVAFDVITMNNMSTSDEDANVTIKKLELIKPSPTLSNEIAKAFGGDDEAFEEVEGDIGIGGFDMVGLDVAGDDGKITMDKFMFGAAEDKTGVFTIRNLNMDIQEDEDVKLSLGSIDVTGVNIDKYKGLVSESFKSGKNGEEIGEEAMKKIMNSMNPYAPDYKNFSLKNFDMDVAGLTVDVASIDGETTVKNGITTITQNTSPMIITPPAEGGKKEMQQFTTALSDMGYDRLVFQSSSKSILDEARDSVEVIDSYLEMENGFKLNFDYSLNGVKELMEKATALSANNAAANNPLAAMEMLSSMTVSKARIAFQDNSIVDRSFKFAAKQQGSDVDMLRNSAKAGLAFLPMMAKDPAQQTLAMEASQALGSFLDNSGTLVIEMNPPTPVDMGAVTSGAQQGNFDVSTLGLSIRAE